jgi:hypothetical protein
MNTAQWKPLFRKYLTPALPEFIGKGSLLYDASLEQLLRGFYFEASGWNKEIFYLWVFVQPLFVPSDHFSFLLGKRIGSSTGLRLVKGCEEQVMSRVLACIQEEGLPFLSTLSSPIDIAKRAKQIHPNSHDPYIMESVAYALILAGLESQAKEEMAHFLTLQEKEAKYDWQFEQIKRVQLMKVALAQSPEIAVQLLMEWREYSLKKLGLI